MPWRSRFVHQPMSIGAGTRDSKARTIRHSLGDRKGSSAGSREVKSMSTTGAHRHVPGIETRWVTVTFPVKEAHPDGVSAIPISIRNIKNIKRSRQIEILGALKQTWGEFDAWKLIKFGSLRIGREHDMPARKLDNWLVFIPSQRIAEF